MSLRRLFLALGTGLCATLLWDVALLLPFKLLVVFVHEIWHGLAALMSGALLDQINISADEFGETMVKELRSTSGFLFTVSAGYPGTALTGALLLNRGLAGRGERLTLGVFGLMLLYMSFLFTSPATYAFYAGLGWAAGAIVLAFANRTAAGLALVVLGTLCVWYSIQDLYDFTRDVTGTDAGIMARYLIHKGHFVSYSEVTLATIISIFWTFLMMIIIAVMLKPVLLPAHKPQADESAEEEPQPMEFPAEITPEMQEWFLENGFGVDGKPLPLEAVDSSEADSNAIRTR